jgi:hypothetical protein
VNEYVMRAEVAQLVEEYFDRMSATDKNHIMAGIFRIERKLLLAGPNPGLQKAN